MPCYDGGPSPYADEEARQARDALSQRDAMLCAILHAVEARGPNAIDQLLEEVNWKEAGMLPSDVLRWWSKHKRADKERRKREAEEKARRTLIDRLTPEERRLLRL